MTKETASNYFVYVWIAAAAVILIGGPAGWVVLRASDTYKVPAGTQIADVVSGTWAWVDASCEEDTQRISFSPDQSEMYIAHSRSFRGVDGVEDSITSYRVVGKMRDRVRGQIPGESRLTASGEPAVWDLVLLDQNTFVWHRTDWMPGSYTKEMLRCS